MSSASVTASCVKPDGYAHREAAVAEQAPPSDSRNTPVSACGMKEDGLVVYAAVLRRLVLFVVGLVVIFSVLELGFVLFEASEHRRMAHPYRVPTPYVEFYQAPDYVAGGISTNGEGFRYGPLPLEKPENEIRVFFLSTSVGFRGKTNETTISGLMESRIGDLTGEGDPRVRVVNASGVSFGSTQSLVLLVTRLLDYSPDLIVVFQGTESLLTPAMYEGRPGYPFNFSVRESQHEHLMDPVASPNPLLALLMRTRTMRHFHADLLREDVQEKLSELNTLITLDELSDYDPYIDVVVEDVRKMSQIASSFACRTVTAVPPIRASGLLANADARLRQRLRVALERDFEHDAMYVEASEFGVEITRRQLWASDRVHWRYEANELFADQFVRALVERGWLGGIGEPVALEDRATPMSVVTRD